MKKTAKQTEGNTESTSRKRIGKLKTAHDVAKYMARCIRKAEGGGDSNRYYKQVMMASMLLKAIEASSLEDRLAKLESIVSEREQKR